MSGLHVGVDVGGTNTDAVLVHGRQVLAEVKTPTTENVTEGIVAALRSLLAGADVAPGEIDGVMIGTTHFTNAVVEAKHLVPTGIVRLCGPATRAIPPLTDWPGTLAGAVRGDVALVAGGHEFDGREISVPDRDELVGVCRRFSGRGITSVALTSVFSPVDATHERLAAEIIEQEMPGVALSLSSEIGRMGLLERENATIVNACLRALADRIVDAFRRAVAGFGIDAPVFVSQNDGTLMSAEHTNRYPVATFASGPTNSMRGAAFLSGETDCAVVDIGGTTSDVGILRHGFPREASVFVDIGGVRTNFRMPDVLPLGIGGGSIVRTGDTVTVGPDSVGYRLTSEARVFGGPVLTATDLAVAAGMAEVGDPSLVADLDHDVVVEGLAFIERHIAVTLDRMKTGPEPIPVVLVGGGSILLSDGIPGASRVRRPDHFAVANAIGAAIAQVGGDVDRVFSLDGTARDRAVEAARSEAIERCIEAGADPESVRIVDVEEVPLAYLPSNALRLKVKAIGDLRSGGIDANPG